MFTYTCINKLINVIKFVENLDFGVIHIINLTLMAEVYQDLDLVSNIFYASKQICKANDLSFGAVDFHFFQKKKVYGPHLAEASAHTYLPKHMEHSERPP